ncbi:response regulator [Paenibacillus chitinolyticus]|uniref:response regulator n=1 Tax=Paenibacillus chitinolyticus TaxID=79263 RepID=UPI003656813F
MVQMEKHRRHATKILIVDDEPDLRKLLTDYLEINGYVVMVAQNSREVIRQIEEHPDLILLDINMPEMDGLELCRKIRNFISCPILFLTARVEDTSGGRELPFAIAIP